MEAIDPNPYNPPPPIPTGEVPPVKSIRGPWLLAIEWTAVLMFNMIVPVLLGWSMTNSQAKMGSAIAVALVATLGYYACVRFPTPMLLTIRGGMVVAVSQVFPVLQVLCGALAIHGLIVVGWIQESSFREMLSFVFSGFMVTLLTGLFLLATSLVIGLFLRCVTPTSWWQVQVRASTSNDAC